MNLKFHPGTTEYLEVLEPRFNEVDSYRIVHHSVYLCWFEAARMRYARRLGIEIRDLLERDLCFVLSSCQVKFISPVKLGMQVKVTCSLVHRALAKLVFYQTIQNQVNGQLLIEAQIEIVIVNAANGMQPVFLLPNEVEDALKIENRKQVFQNTRS